MPRYRMAIRFGEPRPTYHVEDLEAESLREALRRGAAAIPDHVDRTADLVEIRRAIEPDARPAGTG